MLTYKKSYQTSPSWYYRYQTLVCQCNGKEIKRYLNPLSHARPPPLTHVFFCSILNKIFRRSIPEFLARLFLTFCCECSDKKNCLKVYLKVLKVFQTEQKEDTEKKIEKLSRTFLLMHEISLGVNFCIENFFVRLCYFRYS